MGKFTAYSISLRSFSEDVQTFNYELNKEFFEKIDSPEISDGEVNATVVVKKKVASFEFCFNLEGKIRISCDRCLEMMDFYLNVQEVLFVKLGDTYREENENLIVIPESEGQINVAWFLYEFIALSIPTRHVHEIGKCNKSMLHYLSRNLSSLPEEMLDEELDQSEEQEERMTDPRWDGLKDIIENN